MRKHDLQTLREWQRANGREGEPDRRYGPRWARPPRRPEEPPERIPPRQGGNADVKVR
jgi:hypothetical protein